jgi:hypothetical protein
VEATEERGTELLASPAATLLAVGREDPQAQSDSATASGEAATTTCQNFDRTITMRTPIVGINSVTARSYGWPRRSETRTKYQNDAGSVPVVVILGVEIGIR